MRDRQLKQRQPSSGSRGSVQAPAAAIATAIAPAWPVRVLVRHLRAGARLRYHLRQVLGEVRSKGRDAHRRSVAHRAHAGKRLPGRRRKVSPAQQLTEQGA